MYSLTESFLSIAMSADYKVNYTAVEQISESHQHTDGILSKLKLLLVNMALSMATGGHIDGYIDTTAAYAVHLLHEECESVSSHHCNSDICTTLTLEGYY